MIAYLQGKILDISESTITLLTTSGVGYEVFINDTTYAKLVGETETSLYIYHHITEGAQSLFGCSTTEDKKVFTELIKISGVGGKVALNILNLGTEKLAQALAFEDTKIIESIKGIGKKMSEKIVLELKDKDFIKHAQATGGKQESSHISALDRSQIIDTLTNMGYSKDAIQSAMQDIPKDMVGVDEILPFIIKNI